VSPEERLEYLGIALPKVSSPVANYVAARRTGSLLYLSGHVSRSNGTVVTGRLGETHDRDEGYALARAAAIDLLSSARATLGSLDHVRGVVKLTGFVNSTGDFTDQPFVVNGASDLFVSVFETAGRHARSAVGVAQLPLGAAVELEAILEVE
jgi:enamine deaminase RidA (YjgF/YER057c/UK114 family)